MVIGFVNLRPRTVTGELLQMSSQMRFLLNDFITSRSVEKTEFLNFEKFIRSVLIRKKYEFNQK